MSSKTQHNKSATKRDKCGRYEILDYYYKWYVDFTCKIKIADTLVNRCKFSDQIAWEVSSMLPWLPYSAFSLFICQLLDVQVGCWVLESFSCSLERAWYYLIHYVQWVKYANGIYSPLAHVQWMVCQWTNISMVGLPMVPLAVGIVFISCLGCFYKYEYSYGCNIWITNTKRIFLRMCKHAILVPYHVCRVRSHFSILMSY